MIATAVSLLLIAAMAAASVRLFTGPTLYDRALAAHVMTFLGALLMGALAVLARRMAWVDVAIALLIADFVLAAAVLKTFRARSLQTALARLGEEDEG